MADGYDSPSEQPGLGTVFGETRESRTMHQRFERADSRPFAEVALWYNDWDGIRAQVAYRGGPDPALYARTPHGGVTVWLIDESGNVMPGVSAGGRSYVVGSVCRMS